MIRLTLLAAFALGLLMGCAPSRTIPKGMPYPTKLRPQMRVYPMEKVRCLGGGIGGCSPFNLVH